MWELSEAMGFTRLPHELQDVPARILEEFDQYRHERASEFQKSGALIPPLWLL